MNSDCFYCSPTKPNIEGSPVTYKRKYYSNDDELFVTNSAVTVPNSNRSSSGKKVKEVTFKMNDSPSAAKMYAQKVSAYTNGHSELEAPSTPTRQHFHSNSNDDAEMTPTGSAVSSSSSDVAGAYSKKAMVKMMKEQIDLMRNLTNVQMAQKKELEEVKAEKKKLEDERIANDAKNFSSSSGGGGGKLNLPTRSTSGGKDSDNHSISTFSRYFRSPNKQPRTTKYRHPDEEYYARDRAQRERARTFSDDYNLPTLSNCDPSLASTIMPSAILIDPAAVNNTGAFSSNDLYNGQHSLPHRFQSPSKDRIEITPIPERNVIPADELETGCLTKMWWFFSRLCTFFIPDILLCCIGRKAGGKVAKAEAKQAWREKVGIFVIMMLSSAAFIGVSGVVPMFLCRETQVFTMVSFASLICCIDCAHLIYLLECDSKNSNLAVLYFHTFFN